MRALLTKLRLSKKEDLKKIKHYIYMYRYQYTFYNYYVDGQTNQEMKQIMSKVEANVKTVEHLLNKDFAKLTKKEIKQMIDIYKPAVEIVDKIGRQLVEDKVIDQKWLINKDELLEDYLQEIN